MNTDAHQQGIKWNCSMFLFQYCLSMWICEKLHGIWSIPIDFFQHKICQRHTGWFWPDSFITKLINWNFNSFKKNAIIIWHLAFRAVLLQQVLTQRTSSMRLLLTCVHHTILHQWAHFNYLAELKKKWISNRMPSNEEDWYVAPFKYCIKHHNTNHNDMFLIVLSSDIVFRGTSSLFSNENCGFFIILLTTLQINWQCSNTL